MKLFYAVIQFCSIHVGLALLSITLYCNSGKMAATGRFMYFMII